MDARGLRGVDVEHHPAPSGRVRDGAVAERRAGGHEPALGHAAVGAVGGAFPDPFAFELSEQAEQLQHHPPRRRTGVDIVPGRDHPDTERVELPDQGEQVQQAAAEAVQLRDHHDIDLAGQHRRDQLIQRRTCRRRAGHAGVDELADHAEPVQLRRGRALLALAVDRRPVYLRARRDPQIRRRTPAPRSAVRATLSRHSGREPRTWR